MNKKNIVWIILITIAIAGASWLFLKEGYINRQEVSTLDPIDIVLDFYTPWLDARQSTSTDPYAEKLANAPILSKELRKEIYKFKESLDTDIDPVLCQTAIPTNLSARYLYKSENESKILVLARDEGLDGQAVITLNRQDGGWYIKDIICYLGEFGPEREFSFEKEGNLLKSVLPPLDPQYWHLVFEEDGQLGHVAPLFFDEASICVSSNGEEKVCDPNQFTETAKATIYGEMMELGVSVKKLQLIE